MGVVEGRGCIGEDSWVNALWTLSTILVMVWFVK